MTFKQLYMLHEICKIRQNIGMEQVRPDPWFPVAELSYIDFIRKRRSTKRETIRWGIWKQIEQISQRFHDRKTDLLWDDDLHHDKYRYIVLWDHWQPPQKYFLCGRHPRDPSTRPSLEKQCFWEDSSDEEV